MPLPYRHAINQFEFFATLSHCHLVTPTSAAASSSSSSSSAGLINNSNSDTLSKATSRTKNCSDKGDRGHVIDSKDVIEILDSDDDEFAEVGSYKHTSKKRKSARHPPTDPSHDDDGDDEETLPPPTSTRLHKCKQSTSSSVKTDVPKNAPTKVKGRKKAAYLVIDSDSEECDNEPDDEPPNQVTPPKNKQPFIQPVQSPHTSTSLISSLRPHPSSGPGAVNTPHHHPVVTLLQPQPQPLHRPVKQHMDTKFSFLHGAAKLIDATLGYTQYILSYTAQHLLILIVL